MTTPAIRRKHLNDAKMVAHILSRKDLPAVTRGRNAYVIYWAGGRATCAMRSKAAIKAWFANVGEWAELVSIRYRQDLPPFVKIYTMQSLKQSLRSKT